MSQHGWSGLRRLPVRVLAPGWNAPSLLVVGLLAAWVGVLVAGGPTALASVYDILGLRWSGGIAAGQVWQLLTHALLHGSWAHVLGNVGLIYALGGRVYQILGGRAFVGIFLAGTLAGALAHLAVPPLGHPEPSLVGASGGAVALLTAYATLAPDARLWPLPLRAANLARGVVLAAALLAIYQAATALGWLARPAGTLGGLMLVGHAYHLGGALAGWLCARRALRC